MTEKNSAGPSRLRALQRYRVIAVFDRKRDGRMCGFHFELCADGNLVMVEDLEAFVGPVSVETKKDEEPKDDHARVDGVPEGEHGDLPQRATGDESTK